MPTVKPRIQVTLDLELFDLVSDIARITGKSRSSVISELLGEARESLRTVRDVLTRASTIQNEFKAGLRDALGAVGTSLDHANKEASDALQTMLRLVNSAEDPRPVTRGSGTHHRRRKNKRK